MAILPSFPLILLILISLINLPNCIHASVADSCKDAAASSPNINVNFCITSLQADPSSGFANKTGLALIATDLTSKNATNTKSEIQTLLKDPSKSNVNVELDTCDDLYSDMIDRLATAYKAIESSSFNDAKTYLSAALDAPIDCEDSFSEKGAASVLTNEDAYAKQLCAIALALISI